MLLFVPAVWCYAEGFWITDGGNKFIMLVNFLRHGEWAIHDPAVALDPLSRFFPDGIFHFQRCGGKIYSVFTEFFPLLAAPFYRWLGFPGLLIWPLAGGLWTLWAESQLLRSLKFPPGAWFLLPLSVLALPLGFYAAEFWEMTLFAGAALSGVALMLRRNFVAAGLVLAAGLWLREEFYVLIPILAVVWGWSFREWRGPLRMLLICGAGAGLLWLYQYGHYGHILGLHGSRYYQHNAPATPEPWWCRLENYWIYLLRFQAGSMEFRWFYGVLYLPFALTAVAGAWKRRPHRLDTALLALTAVSSVVLLVLLWRNPFGSLNTVLLTGLWTGVPVAAGFWLNWRRLLTCRRGVWRFLTAAVLLYTLVLPPVLTRSDLGVIWGPRHFLWLLPLLLLGSFYALRRRRFWFGVLALATVGIQGYGLLLLKEVKAESAGLTAELRRAGAGTELMLTDAFFLPEMTPELFFERPIRLIRDDAALDDALVMLRERGVSRVLLVLSTTHRRISNPALARALQRLRPVAPVRTSEASGAPFLRVRMAVCELQP